MSKDVRCCFLMRPVYLSHSSCKLLMIFLSLTEMTIETMVLSENMKMHLFTFLRWDEDTIELAQTWMPKDISRD